MSDLFARYPAAGKVMPAALAAELAPHALLVRAKRGRTLVALGASTNNVFMVLEGRAQVALCSPGGREVILRDLAAGALFGELAAIDGQPRSASIVTLDDCVLASIPGDVMRNAMCATPEAALWIAQRLVAQVRDLTERVFEMNTLRVPSRLHCELLRLCTAVEGDAERTLDPSPTHAELAARIGTHREAVTRELGYLVEQGIVEQQRRRLTIVDVPALVRLVHLASGNVGGNHTGLARGPHSAGI